MDEMLELMALAMIVAFYGCVIAVLLFLWPRLTRLSREGRKRTAIVVASWSIGIGAFMAVCAYFLGPNSGIVGVAAIMGAWGDVRRRIKLYRLESEI